MLQGEASRSAQRHKTHRETRLETCVKRTQPNSVPLEQEIDDNNLTPGTHPSKRYTFFVASFRNSGSTINL